MPENANIRKPHRLVNLSDACACDDGLHMAFKIETNNAAPFDLEVPLSEIGTIVEYLVSTSELANKDMPHQPQQLVPIPIKGLGFSTGRDANETLLVVRMHGFDLSFALDSTRLKELAASFSQTAHLLSAHNLNSH